MIKPIETRYNGYLFRSRLEARWAIFFDLAGIPYEYEPEGFDINGVYYLPDFYLKWFNAYVEIKPTSLTEFEKSRAMSKLESIYRESDNIALICFGDPFENEMYLYSSYSDDSGGGDKWTHAQFVEGGWFSGTKIDDWSHSGGKHFISLVADGDDDESFYSINNKTINIETTAHLESFRSKFDYAKEKARQARFEHGETLKIRRW